MARSNQERFDFKELMLNETKAMYYYEKIMKQKIDENFPERKLYWFYEMVKEDKEFKVD